MITNKILFLSVVGSLFLHGLALCMTGIVQMRQTIPEAKILMVDLEGEWIEKEKNQPTTIMESLKKKTELPAIKQQGNSRPLEGKKEDTVDLGNLVNTHYKPYLVKIKKRIERFWGYPSAAAARRIEGTAMILFSVAADGALDSIMITTSSGSALLDQGTISAIQSASPFEPLPPAYGLSKLNIQASFAYNLSN